MINEPSFFVFRAVCFRTKKPSTSAGPVKSFFLSSFFPFFLLGFSACAKVIYRVGCQVQTMAVSPDGSIPLGRFPRGRFFYQESSSFLSGRFFPKQSGFFTIVYIFSSDRAGPAVGLRSSEPGKARNNARFSSFCRLA